MPRRSHRFLRRALTDTRRSASLYGVNARIIAGFVLGSVFHYLRLGPRAMMDEWQVWISYVLMGVGCLTLLEFLGNLAFAPFRIERDRADAAEKRLGVAEQKLSTAEAASRVLPVRFQSDGGFGIHNFLGWVTPIEHDYRAITLSDCVITNLSETRHLTTNLLWICLTPSAAWCSLSPWKASNPVSGLTLGD